jgi:hypothetical protein
MRKVTIKEKIMAKKDQPIEPARNLEDITDIKELESLGYRSVKRYDDYLRAMKHEEQIMAAIDARINQVKADEADKK